MTIDSHYIPAFSIEEVILDKDTGAPLSGGLVYFEQDDQRGVLKPVYQITGTSPNYSYIQLPNPMTLSSIGTFEDSLSNPTVPYFYPYDGDFNVELYYVRVTSSDDVPQFDREAVPYIALPDNADVISLIVNELSNPQFSEVLFDTTSSSYTYNVNAVTDNVISIAPDWDLIVSASSAGTITVSQLKPIGSLNIAGNPGTILTIDSAGLSKLQLRQRIFGSPNLWGSGYLSATFLAKTYSGTSVLLNMFYSQSSGAVVDQQFLPAASLPASGAYTSFSSTVLIPASNSSESYPTAYIDIYFDIPLSIQIDISNIMVAFTGATSINNIAYDQESNARQIDHLFHYYKPQLDFKPIPSMLTGWDFPLNPAQINSSSVTMSTTAAYMWDQTIGKSVVGNIAVARNSVTNGIQATTANNLEAFYYIQYLSGAQAKKILGTKLAVNVNAFRTQTGGECTCRVYLYRGTAASSFPTLPTSIGTLASSGIFTLTAASWALIPRGNEGQAQGVLSVVNTADYTTLNDVVDLQFNDWEINVTGEIADTDKFAIVVTFQCPTTGTVIVANSISLVPGDIPTRPAPQARDEVIRECQYYYETSKDIGVAITTSADGGALLRQQAAFTVLVPPNAIELWPRSFGFEYNTVKRRAITPTIFTEGGLTGNVTAFTYQAGMQLATGAIPITNWTAESAGQKGVQYISNYSNTVSGFIPVSEAVNNTSEAFISFHFEADARLGII